MHFSQKTKRLIVFGVILAGLLVVLTGCTTQGQGSGDYASIPVGKGYADGKEIYFSHTETSDPDIAQKLTDIMDSPVLLVPSLAQASETALADVFVFENGLKGMGPLGFQSDVFNNPPGSEGYSPLRRIILVKWNDESKARELKSTAEIMDAETAGELTITQTDVVVNMPFMVWDGGKR